jgi:hypothetical protein
LTTLADLQRAAQQHVLDAGALPAALAAATAGDGAERWNIYVEAYRLRLVEALATTYRSLAARLGRESFARVAREYIAAHPSTFRSLRDFGADLPAVLAAAAGDPESRMLAELARFEWCLATAFDAATVTAATVADLAGVAPEGWPTLAFAPVPGLGRFATATNAMAVWRGLRDALEADATAGPVMAPAAAQVEHVDWLVTRPALETHFRSLPAGEAEALDALLAGTPFGALCESLVPRHGDGAAVVAATWLKGWLTEGLLLRV